MKKILFVSHSASRTGAPIMLLNSAALLKTRGYECAFILGEDGPLADEFRKIGPTIIEPLYPWELKYWRELKRVSSRFAILSRIKPDLLYCNTIHTAKWLFYARLSGIKTILHVHELSMGFATIGVQEHLIIRRLPDKIIAASEAVRNYLITSQRIFVRKIELFYESILTNQFSPNMFSEEGKNALKKSLGIDGSLIIGNVGRITVMKGTDLLLDVASIVKEKMQGEQVKFLLVATTEDKEFYRNWRDRLRTERLEDDFVIVENQRDVAMYYNIMDVYVSTAREDPFPLVVLEAMASGLPAVAYSVGGIPEQLSAGSGVLVDNLDREKLADEIVALMNDAEKRKRIGSAAAKRAHENFDLTINIGKLEAIIRSVIG